MTDAETDLPPGWTKVALGTVSGEPDQHVPAADETFSYIDIGSIDRAAKVIRAPQRMLGKDAPSRARKKVAAGDTLVSMTRPNLNAVALVPDALDAQIASTGFDVLRPAPGIDPRWLAYLVRTEEFVRAMSDVVQGALYPAVRTKDVRGFVAPLAPAPEQTRIADKLDVLLKRVDACRERLDRVPGILKRFRQSVLAAATSGELTREWREDHATLVDAHALSSELETAHAEAGGHKAGNAAQPTEDVHDLSAEMFPFGWSLLTLRDLVRPDRPITYGILKPGPELDDGVPYVRVADFPNDRLNLATVRRTSPAMDEEFKRSRLQSGDLLLSIRGTVGRLVVVPPELERANITQDTARISLQPGLNPSFVLWTLRSELVQQRMRRAVKGVAVRGINIGDVRALQVPLPSRAEQDEIVRRVEKLLSQCEEMESQVERARKHVGRLTPIMLTKAFLGQLVPQDPTDEPASALLARLKTAQTNAAAESSRRRPKTQGKRPIMSNADKDTMKAAILKLKTDRFSFDELRAEVSGDYESLKAALFELLEESRPVVRQVFDQKAKEMKLVRVKP